MTNRVQRSLKWTVKTTNHKKHLTTAVFQHLKNAGPYLRGKKMLFHMYAILDMPFQQKELYLWLINAGAVRQFLGLDSYYRHICAG